MLSKVCQTHLYVPLSIIPLYSIEPNSGPAQGPSRCSFGRRYRRHGPDGIRQDVRFFDSLAGNTAPWQQQFTTRLGRPRLDSKSNTRIVGANTQSLLQGHVCNFIIIYKLE